MAIIGYMPVCQETRQPADDQALVFEEEREASSLQLYIMKDI